MTPQEFKAWFDGFTEAMSGVPTKAQWTRVKDRVAEIDGKPVTERVFIDRYYPSYPRQYWTTWTTYNSAGSVGLMSCNSASSPREQMAAALATPNNLGGGVFNASAAMADLGRADAKALAA